jgi:hypothetical protein
MGAILRVLEAVVDPGILEGRKANPIGKKPLYKNVVTGSMGSIFKM